MNEPNKFNLLIPNEIQWYLRNISDLYVACFQKSFEYIECMATFYFTNSNYLDMGYSSSKAKRTSFKLHNMRRASNYNFHNWTLFKTIFTDLEMQFITYLKPYSHGISIIWGPCVIWNYPPTSESHVVHSHGINEACDFYSNLLTYLPDTRMSRLWESRSMVRLDGFKKRNYSFVPCVTYFSPG